MQILRLRPDSKFSIRSWIIHECYSAPPSGDTPSTTFTVYGLPQNCENVENLFVLKLAMSRRPQRLKAIIPSPKAFCDTASSSANKSRLTIRLRAFVLISIFVFGPASPCDAYSVLSHEAVVDAAWDDAIKPLLLKRFPNSTPEELKEAHSYAYGGSVIQDLGYYPFGSHFFSDLVHYVRTGDFVQALMRDSSNLDEYAFALGALAHYAADNEGHRLAVNKSVPLLYPKLRKKYGDVVTYDESPSAHLKTEFGFDVVQIARGRYGSDAYHDYIGFHVSKELLDRAFLGTYSL